MALSADESIASLAEANTYATAREWTDWAAATDGTKEAKLREGTAYIVAIARWPGSLASTSQVLPWPRVNAYDPEGRYIEGVPSAVKAATIEAARLALTAPLMGGVAAGYAQTIRERVGSLEVEYARSSAVERRADRMGMVHMLLRSVGASIAGGANVRLSKA